MTTFAEMFARAENSIEYWKEGCRLLADEVAALEAEEAENARLNLRVDALSREVMDCPNCERLRDEVTAADKRYREIAGYLGIGLPDHSSVMDALVKTVHDASEVERLRGLCEKISREAKTLCSNVPNCDFRYEHGKIWAAETILKAAGRGEE